MTTVQRSSAASLLTIAGVSAAAIFAARKLRISIPERYSLNGKTVLITGGSRGLGLAIAEEFGAAGARVALCARDEAELNRACELLASKHIEAHAFPVDINRESEIEPLIQKVLSRFGALDVLVNDAGSISVGSFDSFKRDDFEEAMSLMFWAPVHLTRTVLPHMQRMGSGQIVNISSVGGRVSIPHLLPYCCAKFALTGFSTGLTTEVKPKGVHVLTVFPGLLRTGSYLNAQFKGASKQEFTWFGLLGNLPGFSVAADYAAKEIRASLEARDYNCVVSLPAKVLITLEALAPEINRSLLELTDRFLPQAKDGQTQRGKEMNPRLNALFQGLTVLGRLAAQRFNE